MPPARLGKHMPPSLPARRARTAGLVARDVTLEEVHAETARLDQVVVAAETARDIANTECIHLGRVRTQLRKEWESKWTAAVEAAERGGAPLFPKAECMHFLGDRRDAVLRGRRGSSTLAPAHLAHAPTHVQELSTMIRVVWVANSCGLQTQFQEFD